MRSMFKSLKINLQLTLAMEAGYQAEEKLITTAQFKSLLNIRWLQPARQNTGGRFADMTLLICS